MSEELQMKYFVLKPAGDDEFAEASRRAMQAYADHIEDEHSVFARKLSQWANNETVAAERRTIGGGDE